MERTTVELLLIFALLLGNGLFAMAEASVLASRKTRLKDLANKGSARAKIAFDTAANPVRFLSTVQIGITLISVFAGALGGDLLAQKLAGVLEQVFHINVKISWHVALGIVVVGITLCSLIIGELVPKRIALHSPERVAMGLVPPINIFSKIVAPLVRILTFLTDLILKPLGFAKKNPKDRAVSNEEVTLLIEEGLHAGSFNKVEKDMVEGVLDLDELSLASIMTPRPKIIFLNIDDTNEANWRKIVVSGHSHFPVFQGSRDKILGIVSVKSIWANSSLGLETSLKNLLVPAVIVPETMLAMSLLERFKKSSQHIALVADHSGAIKGIVTLFDVFEAIVGDLPQAGRVPQVTQRTDGSWLIDATLPVSELKDMFALKTLPHKNHQHLQTLGDYMTAHLEKTPQVADFFTHDNLRFEVVDMDGRRVDKVLISKIPPPPQPLDKPPPVA